MAKIFQYHSSIIPADAIGTSITLLHKYLTEGGYQSFLVANNEDNLHASGSIRAANFLNSVMGEDINDDDVLLLHFSFYDTLAGHLSTLPMRRILVYHNITPGFFFRDAGMNEFAAACDEGRKQLRRIAPHFSAAVGDSECNSYELIKLNYANVSTIPVMLDLDSFRYGQINAALYHKLRQDAEINILFVGRMVPNKRIERLLHIVAKFKESFPLSVRLHLVGKIWSEEYYSTVMQKAAELGVASNITFHQNVDGDTLRTLYASATAFVSMSDHEGFMVPIVEAFASGCPVIALNRAAVGETTGGAGLLIDKPDPNFAASLIYLVGTDSALRNRIIAAQAQRALDFDTSRSAALWIDKIFPRNVGRNT